MSMDPRKKQHTLAYLLLTLALLVLLALGLLAGSTRIPAGEAVYALFGAADGMSAGIVRNIRLPRVLAAVLLGGALSVAGFLLQTFFGNPIAGPFVLGISSGAKLTVALTMIFCLSHGILLTAAGMIGAAFLGAMLAMSMILLASARLRGMSLLIVCGVMIGYVCSAITEIAVTFADDSNIVNLHYWSMGSFSGIDWGDLRTAALVVLAAFACSILLAKPMDAYRLGEAYAGSMGVNVRRFRAELILLSSLLSATGISINYNSTTATWERDSKSAGFSIYKSHYINVNFSDHQGSKKKFKEGLALYDMEGNMVELIMTTPVYGQVTSSALGDRVQFGRDLSASNSKKFGKGLVGDYRLVPVCQEKDSTQWLPMLESDRYYIEAKLTNYTATLTCHPVTNLEGKAVVVKGGEKVGLSARVDVTLANNSADRYYGNLYLWVDGEALDPTFTPYTSCITAEVPAGEQKTVSFNFTPTTAGTKSIVVTTDQDGMHAVTGATGSMTVEAKSEAAMNLEVAISALGAQQPAQAGEHGIVWDNQVTFKVTVTNKAAGDYNRYVLAPLFIVKTDSAGNTRGSMVTYEQASLNLKPGESKDLQFTFDNLAYGSTYSLNVYARNDEPDDSEASHLTNLVKPGESKYYDLQRGLVTWTASGVRRSQQAAASITIPADAAAVSLEGLSFDNVTASANPNVVYLLGAADTVPAGLQGKNVVLGTVAPSLSLTAGHPFFTPVDFTAQQATFTRSLEPAGERYNWSTMVLPFAPQRVLAQGNEINWRHAPAGRSQQVLVLELVEEDAASSELIFDHAAQMHSCRPYLVALARGVAPAQGMVTFEATQARVTAETKAITSGQSYLLRGTFNTASPAAPYVLRSDLCQFVPSPGVEVQPFEAWAQMLDGTTAATALNIVLPSDIVTGVTGVSVAAPKAGIVYDITGRVMQGSLQELPHGIYIVDGRKVVK